MRITSTRFAREKETVVVVTRSENCEDGHTTFKIPKFGYQSVDLYGNSHIHSCMKAF